MGVSYSRWGPSATQAERANRLKKGDYVLATKYADGDPGDSFCVGFYDGYYDNGTERRHLVVDSEGKQFRRNGHRRVEKLSHKRGVWIVEHLLHIEAMERRYSVWHWYRAPFSELNAIPKDKK